MKRSHKDALWLAGIVIGAAAVAGGVWWISSHTALLNPSNTVNVTAGPSTATVSASSPANFVPPSGSSFLTISIDGTVQTVTPGSATFQATLTAGAHTVTGTYGSVSNTNVGGSSFTVTVTAQ